MSQPSLFISERQSPTSLLQSREKEMIVPRPRNRQPKILMIIESAGGGSGRHTLDLSEALIARGCEVHLIYSPRRMDNVFQSRLAQMQGLHQFQLEMRNGPHPKDITTFRTIRRYIREQGPFDIVHGHASKGGAMARLTTFGANIPSFYTPHGLVLMNPAFRGVKWLVFYIVELLLSRLTSRLVTVGPEESRAARRYKLGHHRVITIPNGVKPAVTVSRDEARRTLGIADDDLVIGFVGRLVPEKALDVMIRAFATVTQDVPRARLALIGSGPEEAMLRRVADELHVSDRIYWLGERDAKTLWSAFDLFAMSSRKEGLPYVILEAMAAGLPIVANSACGVELLVSDGVNGAVVPPADSQAMARALIRLASDADHRAACGRASLARVSEFTIDKMADKTLAAYRAVSEGVSA